MALLMFKILGLVAQTISMNNKIGVEWIARTPPKRQVEGSNPFEPATILVLFSGFYQKYGEIERIGEILRIRTAGPFVIVYLCYESANDKGQISDKVSQVPNLHWNSR
jgi:hypothetical protein